jgi:hypothetical protein
MERCVSEIFRNEQHAPTAPNTPIQLRTVDLNEEDQEQSSPLNPKHKIKNNIKSRLFNIYKNQGFLFIVGRNVVTEVTTTSLKLFYSPFQYLFLGAWS